MMISHSANPADKAVKATRDGAKSRGKVTKKNSDARKAQNRNASRAYRERRKHRLALLGEGLDKERGKPPCEKPTDTSRPAQEVASPSLPGNQANQSAPLVCEDLSFDSPWPVPLNDSLSNYLLLRATAPKLSSTLTSLVGLPVEPFNGQALMAPAVPPQLQSQSLSRATTPEQRASSFSALGNLLQLPQEQPVPQSSAEFQHLTDRSAPSISTQKATTSRDESLGRFMEYLMSLRTPTVQRAIYVEQNSLYAAVMDNTLAIGCLQGMQLLFSEDGASPFNKDWSVAAASKGSGSQLLSQIKSQFATMPQDLRPVDEQISIEHHIYLDVLPFPSFRQRALKALAQDPPLFDEDELCADISTHSGLVVWGSLGNNNGMEACRSWDMRSWEPQPWFLRKYWFLVGGWEDEMWKASRWWHAVRNERIGTAGPPRSGLENL